MNTQTFRDLLTRKPFEPFRIVMSSGERYEVRHPEMAWVAGTDILVGIGETDVGTPAKYRIHAMLHVSTVEPLEVDAPSE